MLSCEYGETLEQVDQWSCRCPIPESVLGQTGWGFEQTGLMEGVLTHGSGVQRWSLRSFPAQNILWFCEVSADVQPLHRYQCTVPLSGASHQLWQTTLGRVEHPGHKDTIQHWEMHGRAKGTTWHTGTVTPDVCSSVPLLKNSCSRFLLANSILLLRLP